MKNFLLFLLTCCLSVITNAQTAYFENANAYVLFQGKSLPTTILGINTHFSQGTNTAFFYKSGSPTIPTNDVKLTNIISGSDLILGGILEISDLAQANMRYTCIIKNSLNPDVAVDSFNVRPVISGTNIVSVSPDSAFHGETLSVLITGVNTHFKQGINQVIFMDVDTNFKSGVILNSYQVISNTRMRANLTFSAGSVSSRLKIKVTNAIDGTIINPLAMHIVPHHACKLHAISPESGQRSQTLNVSITGFHTTFTQGSHTISFFSQSSPSTNINTNSVTIINDSNLTANITLNPLSAVGFYGCAVANSKYVQYLQDAFEIKTNLKSVNINTVTGQRGQSLYVSITGLNTGFSKASNTVQFYRQGSPTSEITMSNLTVVSNTLMGGLLNISSGATLTSYSFKVSNTSDGIVSSSNLFQVSTSGGSGSLVNITPARAEKGTTLSVIITGLNTQFQQGSGTNQISFIRQGSPTTEIFPLSINPLSNTALVANLTISSSAFPGLYDLKVVNSTNGIMLLPNAFSVTNGNGPGLISVTPSLGNLRQTLNVTITGTKTHFMQSSQTLVFFRQGSPSIDINVNSMMVNNDSNIVASISIDAGAYTGLYNVGIINLNTQDGLILSDAFEVGWVVGLNKQTEAENDVEVYPNPAKEQINVSCKNKAIEQVELFDLQGRILFAYVPILPGKEIDFKIENFILPKQCYFLKIKTTQGTVYRKLMIE
ncbi:MAG: T9SS type A sorting domain-containing protein [Bacteroidia bacterium]|nr:T9SS type A sorting domain-containing protein [Bacteroidia bacterium]